MSVTPSLARRRLLLAAAASLPLSQVFALGHAANIIPKPRHVDADTQLAQIEAMLGGRVGVAALDTGSGRLIGHRADERFPMCSTFKLLLAGRVLAQVDAGKEKLNRPVRYGQADLLSYAPITKAHLEDGQMSVGDLCAAALQYSDNTAANLLLKSIDGPAHLTAWLRQQGDAITRLDRNEPSLNTEIRGDLRDTTTPHAMLDTVNKLVLGNALSASSRQQLQDWLAGNTTGNDKIRAGLPQGWRVGDKTGSGFKGASNDVAIIWPNDRAPIIVTAYTTENTATPDARSAALAEVGKAVVAAFG